jgi:alkylation response protein AidB-like acyl-CoA dehydrogenase
LGAILRDATELVRRRSRNFYYASAERAADDPLIQETIGQIAANAFAAKSVVLAAADALDEASQAWNPDKPDSTAAHQAALLAAQAKVVVDDLAVRSAANLFDAGGASATARSENLDRHWRNARTIASHNPRAHKAQAIGTHTINGTPLPSKGFF